MKKKEFMEVLCPLKSLGFGLGELRWLCRVASTATILDQNGHNDHDDGNHDDDRNFADQ